MPDVEYVFRQVEEQDELRRLRAIEEVFDPSSRRRLSATGMCPGWSCLEVGPGAGSLLNWMAAVVGPAGRVTGVDLSTKFLSAAQPQHVEIREGDVRTIPLAPDSFDLVHARYVLVHLPDYEAAVSKMIACLKPGGWLVLEEPDFSASRGITGDVAQLAAVSRVNQAIKAMYEARGMDHAVGLHLPGLLQRHGLRGLLVENDAPLSSGGSGVATIMRLSALQLSEKYLATKVVTASDLDVYALFAEDPQTWAIYYGTVAVMGRKL
jgi:2-polyprenyl-3-methyl-5-hydroxy-6-metoxy-1,4-benzoquinol methylase